METDYLIVVITAPSEEVGKKIAIHLIEKRLAACVNILPKVHSIYHWEGVINFDEEVMLLCKTGIKVFESEFIPAVKSLHPYQVPEIIATPLVAGSQDYLDWMASVLNK
jgi:periplasmic divalent cation tolerance protein